MEINGYFEGFCVSATYESTSMPVYDKECVGSNVHNCTWCPQGSLLCDGIIAKCL